MESFIFPIDTWKVSAAPDQGFIVFRPNIAAGPMQAPGTVNPGRSYRLTHAQAARLILELQHAILMLESSCPDVVEKSS